MWGFKQEGGLGGLVGKKKKKKNNEYNVVILFMRGVPAIPCAYPTRCVGCFNIHPGEKKKKSTALPVEGPATASRQRDTMLNSLMMVRQVEKKKPEK